MSDPITRRRQEDSDVRKARKAPRDSALYVTVLHSPDESLIGTSIALGQGLTIGRSAAPNVSFVIADHDISRRHATISLENTVCVVEDHDSTNGTAVEGKTVTKEAIARDSVVRVGDTLLIVGGPVHPPGDDSASDFVGQSDVFDHLRGQVARAAKTKLAALLLGETGVGKEVVAHHLHTGSGLQGPFIPVNCAALPRDLMESSLFGHKKGAFTGAVNDSEGYFAQAEGGTLFLDEIGELPIELQPKLLRAVETGEFRPVGATQLRHSTARLVAATNADLSKRGADGRFRADLYARLAGAVIQIPPLRERRADIALLAKQFLRDFFPAATLVMSASFVEGLLLYDWPLNVRELRTSMHRVALLDPFPTLLEEGHLSELLGLEEAAVPEEEAIPSREALVEVLQRRDGNVAAAAKHFQKDRVQIYRWLKRYGIKAEDFRSRP